MDTLLSQRSSAGRKKTLSGPVITVTALNPETGDEIAASWARPAPDEHGHSRPLGVFSGAPGSKAMIDAAKRYARDLPAGTPLKAEDGELTSLGALQSMWQFAPLTAELEQYPPDLLDALAEIDFEDEEA
jgi:hypothetical protein